MRITTTSPAQTSTQLQPLSKARILESLRPGQLIQARVLSENRSGSVSLAIGGARLKAETQIGVRPGQSLLLQVEKAAPMPELRVLTLPSQKELQATALRQILPRQQSLSALFERLTQSSSPRGGKALPASVKQEIQAMLGRLPSAETPGLHQQIRSALTHSGILSETQLMHGRPSASDMKLNLLKLVALTESLLSANQGKGSGEQSTAQTADPSSQRLVGDLHRQLDGALARVQLNQLCSLPQEDGAHQIWQFELPMRQGEGVDVFQFKLQREGSAADSESSDCWSLSLQMNLASLGPMRVQLRLQDEMISAVVWSENPMTTQLVSDRLPDLQSAFEEAGLRVKRVAAFTGQVEEEQWIPEGISLLDEMA